MVYNPGKETVSVVLQWKILFPYGNHTLAGTYMKIQVIERKCYFFYACFEHQLKSLNPQCPRWWYVRIALLLTSLGWDKRNCTAKAQQIPIISADASHILIHISLFWFLFLRAEVLYIKLVAYNLDSCRCFSTVPIITDLPVLI